MLEEYLVINIFHLLLVFSRLGTLFMLMPGISAPYVSARARMVLAMGVCVVALPTVGPQLPPLPPTAGELFFLIGSEVLIGAFIGAIIQAFMSALHFAGTVIGFNSGMANAMVFDPVSMQQGAMVTGFLGNIAVLLIFITDLHHLLIQATVDSYSLLQPGAPLPLGDFSDMIARVLSESALIGAQLASPFIAFSLVFYTGLGLLSRLSPQMNVFFVGLPIQLMLSMGLLMITVPTIVMTFLGYFEHGFIGFLTPGGG